MISVFTNPVVLSVILAGAITIIGNYLNMRWTRKQMSFDLIADTLKEIKENLALKQDIVKCENVGVSVKDELFELDNKIEARRSLHECKEYREALAKDQIEFRVRIGKESMQHFANHEANKEAYNKIQKHLVYIITKNGWNPAEVNLL
jgi:hypothetical protein